MFLHFLIYYLDIQHYHHSLRKTYFHIFLTIEEQKEVNTEYILHLLSGKDKEICISKSDFETLKIKKNTRCGAYLCIKDQNA